MNNLKYSKKFSLRNKNSEANQSVIDELFRLGSKSEKENSMRITIFRSGSFDFPYLLTVNRTEMDSDTLSIEIIVRVQILKLILLNTFSGILVSILLYLTFESYWVVFPALFYSLTFYQIGRKRIFNFAEKLVNSWFTKQP